MNSSELGFAKPDKQFFETGLRKIQSTPAHTLFIDDQLENILAAEEMGINSVHFQSSEALVKTLERIKEQYSEPGKLNL